MESKRLSDDTIVEIDENMLRREIARMKKLREYGLGRVDNPDSVPSNDGGHDKSVMDDFGGGEAGDDPFLDGEVTTESEEMDESDEPADGDDIAEADMTELGNRRKADENDASANSDLGSSKMESLKRRVAFEKRLQERAKARASALKKEAVSARPIKKAQLKKEYAQIAERYNASVARTNKFTKLISESAKKARSNSGSQQADIKLRKQLAEQNLLNTKLIYANKLLQNESLSKRQKVQVIEKLDEARTSREAKLVYESLAKALAGHNKPLRENAGSRVLGSSSRVTTSGSSQKLNEGFETDRWATLAGITKR